jgi:hypothetical protein
LGLAAALIPALAGLKAQSDIYMLLGFSGKNQKATNSDPIVGVYDLNNDGKYGIGSAELFPFMKKVLSVNGGKGAFIMDMARVIENGEFAFYIADAGDGYIYRIIDQNGNGLLDDTEQTTFQKFGTASTFGPNTIAATRLGNKTITYTALNTRGRHGKQGIHRMVDLNNNGKASDQGETTLLLNATSKLTLPGKTTNVVLSTDRWEKIRVDPLKGHIVAFNSGSASATPALDAFAYLGIDDKNGKIANARTFFNPSKLNGFKENVDISSGALEDLDIQFLRQTTKTFFNGFSFFDVEPKGFRNVFPAYYFTNNYGPTRSFGAKNASGKLLNGVVLLGVDKNLDGDIQDKGEVVIFFNGSGNTLAGGLNGAVSSPTWFDPTSNGNVSKIPDFVVGMAVADKKVYLCIENGGSDQILELDDKNGNLKIETGEVKVIYLTPKPFPKVFNSSFGPWTNNLHAIPADQMPNPFPIGVTPFGKGCSPTTGLAPRMSITGGSPTLGNSGFIMEMVRGAPRLPSFLFLGISDKTIGAISLPLPLNFLGMTGCFQRVSNELVLPTVNTKKGKAKVSLPIPNDPKLKGITLFFQYWTTSIGTNPANRVASNAVQVKIQ